MEPRGEKEHLLALKVMRLTKPSLMLTHPIHCDSRDIPGVCLNKLMQEDLAAVKNMEFIALGELLTLPQNFGNIFLGETFSSYISVHNESIQTVKDISVKADLQTSSQRLMLSGGGTETLTELLPEESIDDVIHHEVKELGTHILVCAVSYVSPTGEKLYFRKFFKFQVLKPLDVKTKFYNAESDDVYLEAQVQNITPSPVFMEKVWLEPSPMYDCKELNAHSSKESDKEVFIKSNYINSLDVRQYLYCLSPKPDIAKDTKLLKGVTNIGKLDIVWRTNMGEKGRLQTSALQRVSPGYGDIRLMVVEIPEAIPVEQTFNLTLQVTNCCERTMDLILVLQNHVPSSGLLWCGISGKQLGKLAPNESLLLHVTMLATLPGLQTISGLRLTDTFLKRTYEHDEIAQMFVYSDQDD